MKGPNPSEHLFYAGATPRCPPLSWLLALVAAGATLRCAPESFVFSAAGLPWHAICVVYVRAADSRPERSRALFAPPPQRCWLRRRWGAGFVSRVSG